MICDSDSNRIRIDTRNADIRGRIAVWDLAAKKWIWRYPIDVRELVGSGVATLEPGEDAPPRPEPLARL
jgi:hypothetical protein